MIPQAFFQQRPGSTHQCAGPPSAGWKRASSRKLHWKDALEEGLVSIPRTLDVFTKIENDVKLGYDLPPKNAVAGRILTHCMDVVTQVINQHKPLIYKFGYCYDAPVRFYNRTFGYVLDKEKWDFLLVLYASSETISPGFVEASLIHQFKGNSG